MNKKNNPHHVGWILFAGILAITGFFAGLGGLTLVSEAYSQHYAGRIYPGVNVYGASLGGLTADEAVAALQSGLPDPAKLPLTLRDGERVWSHSWADMVLRLDPAATASLAYQVGRSGTPTRQRIIQLRALLFGWPLSPVIVLPDPAQASVALQALAPKVLIPPVNATLIIQPGSVLPVPAQAGRELDIEATIAVLPHAIGISSGSEGVVMELLTRPVEPAISDPGPAQAQAEAMLARPFTLVADDLTGFSATWTVEPEAVAEWLLAQLVEDENDGRLIVTVQEDAVHTYLEGLGTQLTDEVSLNVEGTVTAVRTAVEAGRSQATVALTHHPHIYVVQPGDTLMSVAHAHGYPVWRLTEANPDIEPGELRPGQQIVIPSVDVLFPLPPITDRRILVDISDQRLYAYEGETLVYDFIASTGIASSPTIPGVFQVLSKEEEAYASSWDLWMPHFMGIYHTGPDFTNGIHALPTLSSGVRLWEGVLGSPVSYGCIVLGLNEASALYEWAELGTLVVIQE
ncbi:MAG: L,D-transpeptidase family protein [Chloroflexota bacterium]|nr:L,D-transpeptidase family protein [Chloroflexota bacterium]